MSITINPSSGLDSPPSEIRREMLFEKPMTPSDVGKLNRLVIPKKYAEKYLPDLRGGSESLLSFEDEFGKIWRFRYSYWTSSQSYVLTKGWRRYVKEKGLMAGDIVSFQREQCSCDNRLFITWRTRPHNVDLLRPVTPKYDNNNAGTGDQLYRSRTAYCPLRSMMKLSHRSSYSAGGDNKIDIPNNNTPRRRRRRRRRLRLFGVNMEFGRDDQFRFSI